MKLYVKMLLIIIIAVLLPCSGICKRKPKMKKQIIDFDALMIDGKIKKPELMSVMERKELKFKRLLNLDESFINNIIKSIEEF